MALKETLTEIYRLHGGTVVSTVWSFHVLPVFAGVPPTVQGHVVGIG